MDNEYKYICIAKCPKLDIDSEPHCKCIDINILYKHNNICPLGNIPKWVLINNIYNNINKKKDNIYNE